MHAGEETAEEVLGLEKMFERRVKKYDKFEKKTKDRDGEAPSSSTGHAVRKRDADNIAVAWFEIEGQRSAKQMRTEEEEVKVNEMMPRNM